MTTRGWTDFKSTEPNFFLSSGLYNGEMIGRLSRRYSLIRTVASLARGIRPQHTVSRVDYWPHVSRDGCNLGSAGSKTDDPLLGLRNCVSRSAETNPALRRPL